MKNLVIPVTALFLLTGLSANAQTNGPEAHSEQADPIGIPDQPREVSLRSTGYQIQKKRITMPLGSVISLPLQNTGIMTVRLC